jgi:hypothetical protein
MKAVRGGIGKFPEAVIVVAASVKEDERGGQDHTSTSLLHQYDT